MKKSIYLLLLIISLTFTIAFFESLLNNRKSFELQADFHKVISVYPSALALLQEKMEDLKLDEAMELEGIYSIEYKSDYAQLLIMGEPISIRGLYSIQVHLAEDSVISRNLNQDFLQAGSYEQSEVMLLEDQRLEAPFYSVVIMGPIKIFSEKHQGEFFLFNKAALSETTGTPNISFDDFNKNLSMPISVSANLLPFDALGAILIMPMNDFKVILTDDSGQALSSPVFRGQLMRMENFHFISARPWLDSKLEGQAKEMFGSVLGVPCEATIKGELVNLITLKNFDGEFKIGKESTSQKEKNIQWKIINAKSPLISVNLQSLKPQQVLVEIQFRGRVGDFIVDNKSIRDFDAHFIKNLCSIWSNPYLIGLLGALYAALILSWIQTKKNQVG